MILALIACLIFGACLGFMVCSLLAPQGVELPWSRVLSCRAFCMASSSAAHSRSSGRQSPPTYPLSGIAGFLRGTSMHQPMTRMATGLVFPMPYHAPSRQTHG